MDITIARIISRLCEPTLLQLLLVLYTASRGDITGPRLFIVMIILFTIVFFPPLMLLLYAVRTKKISNWDISNRKQRVKALAVFILFLFIDLFIIRSFYDHALFTLFLFFFITVCGFFCITLFWKISGHLSTFTIFFGLIILWFGLRWWPLVLMVPTLAWSRVILKRHTIFQTIGGIVFGACMLLTGHLLHLV